MTTAPSPAAAPADAGPGLLLTELLFALIAVAGSLTLSLGLGLKACPLCLYERAFAMGAAGVLFMCLVAGVRKPGLPAALALPAASAGTALVAVHAYLEWNGTIECPAGFFGVGSAPQQAVVAMVLLTAALLIDALRHGQSGLTTTAILVGLLFAYGAFKSAPPMAKPDKSYPSATPDGCRPPYRAPDPAS